MKRRSVVSSPHGKVVVETRGDLHITGWDRNEVALETNIDGEAVVEPVGDVVSVTCNHDSRLQIPRNADLLVEGAHGNGHIQGVTGAVVISLVSGALELREVGPVQVSKVGGHLQVTGVAGDLTVELVGGHASIRRIGGDLSVEEVGGHLELSDVSGQISAHAAGNAQLDLAPAAGQVQTITAQGSIHCRLPKDANVQVHMESPVFVPSGRRTKTLGSGSAQLTLIAQGPIILNHEAMADQSEDAPVPEGEESEFDWQGDLGAFAEDLTQQIFAKLNRNLNRFSERLPGILAATGLSETETEHIIHQVRVSSEQASARAEEKARRAAETAAHKAQLKMAAALRRATRAGRRGQPVGGAQSDPQVRPRSARSESPGPPRPVPEPVSEPVSDQERLAILRMLQQKKISRPQAEALLATLEGR